MFRPLHLFSSATDPVPCPALLEAQACTIPRCLFSHDVKPTPPPAAPPPPEAMPPATTVRNSYKPTSTPTPTPLAASPVPENERKLREVIERTKTQDMAWSAGRLRISDQTGTTGDSGSAAKKGAVAVGAAAVAAPAGNHVASVLDSPNSWPTPAQTSKRTTPSKGAAGLSPDAFYGTQPPKPKISAATDKTISGGAANTVKSTAATAAAAAGRPLKRPAPDSPNSSFISKADPLKRPKTTITTPSKVVDAKPVAKPAAQLALNPRLVSRAPAPHGQRLQYLRLLHTELTRLSGYPKSEAATQKIIEKCLDIEEEVATTKRDIYRSAISNLCMRYKKASTADYKKEQQQELAKAAPAPAVLVTTRAGLDNTKPPLDTGIAKFTEITSLRELVAGSEDLKKHGYILVPPTKLEIEQARVGLAAAAGYEACERCGQRFQVFPGRRVSDGALTTGGTCNYHPGRKAGLRPSPGSISEQKWTCCSRVVGFDSGCDTALTHVFKVSDSKRLASTLTFTKTPANPNVKSERALALDCEMSYTTHGMELIRLTATAFPSGKIVIDALVKPYGVVLDFNTRFSGVSSEMLTSAPAWRPTGPYPNASSTALTNPTCYTAPKQLSMLSSPAQARKALYHYITPETILIGHALENDLLHLRMCHDAVVDTAVLFPHQRGLPARNKLKYIVERWLGREIQIEGGDSGLRGHDSAVDARCAAELVRWKIRELEERKKL